MHDETIPSVIERDNAQDRALMMTLLLETSHRPWAVDEIAREMGEDVSDSLRRLYGGGLIHRLDGFVWASRAAAMADEIGG
jgi:hypothetical protein